jgi:nitroreductase
MRLQDERHALYGGSVGALAAFGKPLLNQASRVSEQAYAFARVAFAAEIVDQSFAICGLCEHARQRVFSYPAWSGEEQRVRHAFGAQCALQHAYDAFVAKKIIEPHD